MVPTNKHSYPLSVLETLIILTFMVFWAGVNVGLATIGVSAWMYVVTNAAIVCFALLATYFGVEFGDEDDDPLINQMATVIHGISRIHSALSVIAEHTSSTKHLLMSKNTMINDSLKSITELLAKMVVIAQTNDQRISELMATDQQMDTLLHELAHVDPHLLDPNAQTHLDDDPQLAAAVAAIAPPKRPARAGKNRTSQTPELTVVPTQETSEPAEQA